MNVVDLAQRSDVLEPRFEDGGNSAEQTLTWKGEI